MEMKFYKFLSSRHKSIMNKHFFNKEIFHREFLI